MSRRMLSVLGLSAVLSLALAACGSSAASVAPSTAASVAPSTAASVAPAASVCSESSAAGTVKVSIANFEFQPAAITAKVGDVITFTNTDTPGHTATLDDGSCSTPTIATNASDGLTFTAAGTYAFHCSIHSSMKGTITVS